MIAETQALNLKEYGALNKLIDLMHLKGGSVANDDQFIMSYMRGCNVRGWHTIRDRLLALDLIYRDGNTLRSRLVDGHIRSATKQTESKLSPNLEPRPNKIKVLAPEEYRIQKEKEGKVLNGGSGEQGEPAIVVTDYLAQQIQRKYFQ
jgi:hypothetical protein